jgi:hypothetical protein
MELGRVDAFGEDVGKHLGVRDGVDHAVAVKDDPTEVKEPQRRKCSVRLVAPRFLERSSTAEQSMR